MYLFGKLNVSSEVFYIVPVAYLFHYTHTRIFLTYSNAKSQEMLKPLHQNVMLSFNKRSLNKDVFHIKT